MRRLFEPNTRAIGRPPGPTECDAVPDSLIDGVPSELRSANRTCEMGLLHGTERPYHLPARGTKSYTAAIELGKGSTTDGNPYPDNELSGVGHGYADL
jgi:hypothetical protein